MLSQGVYLAFVFIKFTKITIFTTYLTTLFKSEEKTLAGRACRWRKQCVHDMFELIYFNFATSPVFLLVIALTPTVQIFSSNVGVASAF